jgi:hypothetical protein
VRLEEKTILSNSPAVAPATETVIRKRTLSATEAANPSSNQMPELFEYIESLTPERWIDHIAYLYRDDPKATQYPGAPPAYIDKFAGVIEVRPGYSVPMDDAGNIQQAIKDKFGGRVFRMIIKKGRERITEGRFVNEAPPKYPDANPTHFSGQLPQATQTADGNTVAAKAIDAMANQQPDAVRLAMEVLRSASDIVMRQAAPAPAAAPAATNTLDDEFKRELVRRALAPPPDPFEMFIRFKELVAPPATNSVKDTLDLISTLKNSGLIGVAGRGGGGLVELGREMIPIVATTARDAIHEWRLGVEAQVRGVELSRGMNPQPPAAPGAAQQPATMPPAIDATAQAAAPNPGGDAAPQQPVNAEPPFDWLAIKIAEIVRDLNFTVDEAVDEALTFLYRASTPTRIPGSGIVALLLDPPKLDPRLPPGEQGLLTLFQHHPILKQVPVNPRLTEFIKKFMVEAAQSEAERVAAHNAPAPSPSA